MGRGRQIACWGTVVVASFCHLATVLAASASSGSQFSTESDTANLEQHQRRTHLQELSALEAEVEGVPGQQSSHSHYQLSIPGGQCPHTFHRIEFDQIKSGHVKPYILGGDQLPECTNCKRDEERTHFCRQAPFPLNNHTLRMPALSCSQAAASLSYPSGQQSAGPDVNHPLGGDASDGLRDAMPIPSSTINDDGNCPCRKSVTNLSQHTSL